MKKIKCVGNSHQQKIYHNWAKTNELQEPCFKQGAKACQRCFKALYGLCALWWLPWKTQQIRGITCFTNNEKNHFPTVTKLDMRKVWYLCIDLCDMPLTVY